MNLFLKTAALLLLASTASAANKNYNTSDALKTLSTYRHLGTMVTLLKTEMDQQDAEYITKEYKKTGSFVRPLGAKFVGKDSITFAGLQGTLQFRNNGQEVTYRGLVFRMNPDWSFQKNVERIRKQLRGAATAQAWWMPAAHAQFDEASQRSDIEQTGLHLAASLEFLMKQKESGKFVSLSKFAQDPMVDSLLGNGTESLVTSVDCGALSGFEQKDEVSQITITLLDGDKIEIDKIPGDKSQQVSVFSDRKTLPRAMIPDSVATGYGDTFEYLKKHYCPLPQAKKQELVERTLQLAQSHYNTKWGSQPPPQISQ